VVTAYKSRNPEAAKTLCKVPAALPATTEESADLVHTSETFSAHSTQLEDSIEQTDENATQDIIGPAINTESPEIAKQFEARANKVVR